MSRMPTNKACYEFAARRAAKSSGSFHVSRAYTERGAGTMAWSYRTVIGYIPDDENTAYLNRHKYSATTSNQQTLLAGACAMAGLTVVEVGDASELIEIMEYDLYRKDISE